jgi:hypothetical protein
MKGARSGKVSVLWDKVRIKRKTRDGECVG